MNWAPATLVAVRLSLGAYRRGLAILNALCLAAEKRGYAVTYSEEKGRLLIAGNGGQIAVRMTEGLETKVRKVSGYDGKPREERYRLPTGRLRLFIARGYGTEREVTESAAAPPARPGGTAVGAGGTGEAVCGERVRQGRRAGCGESAEDGAVAGLGAGGRIRGTATVVRRRAHRTA